MVLSCVHTVKNMDLFKRSNSVASMSAKHRNTVSKNIREQRKKSFIEKIERYGITEERYNTLRNCGICNDLMEYMYLYGLDLNSNTVFKVMRILDASKRIEQRQRWKWVHRLCCCCWFCGND